MRSNLDRKYKQYDCGKLCKFNPYDWWRNACNGLRSGLTEALKEFCEFRNLIPKNIKLTPDDVWQRIAYVLSIKILDPQFSGQTKERLSSRECASFVSGVVKDSFSLWLNQHTDIAEKIAELAILNAQSRLKTAKKVVRKKIVSGPALPGKLSDLSLIHI